MRLSSVSIGAKMAGGVGGLTLALALTSGFGIRTLSSLGAAYDNAVNRTARKIELAAVINKAGSDMAAGQRGLVLGTYAKNASWAAAQRQVFEDSSAKFKRALADLQPLLTMKTPGKRPRASNRSWLNGSPSSPKSRGARRPATWTKPPRRYSRPRSCTRRLERTPPNSPRCSAPR